VYLLKVDFPAVLNNPVTLGQFLCDAATIGELDKRARSHAINLLLRGYKIPGWILRRRENSFVLPDSLAPLAAESLATVLSTFGTISERRYRSLCAKCGTEPDPAAIIKAGTTVCLSQTNFSPVRTHPTKKITTESEG
jgi:hypothetical protein